MLYRKNLVLCADMWPAPHWTPGGEGYNRNPLSQDSKANEIEENSRIQTTLPSFGSALQAPGIPIEDYSDFSELLTKPEEIIESPGAQDWDSAFVGLSNLQSAKPDNPSNRFQSDTKPVTWTSLSVSNPAPQPQDPSSEKSQPLHGMFFKEIIKDSMTSSSLENSQNPEFRRLRSTASSLAATALAPTTNDRYGRAWGHFKAFCSTMGIPWKLQDQ